MCVYVRKRGREKYSETETDTVACVRGGGWGSPTRLVTEQGRAGKRGIIQTFGKFSGSRTLSQRWWKGTKPQKSCGRLK